MWREPSQNCTSSVTSRKEMKKTEKATEIMGKCDIRKKAKEELCHKRPTFKQTHRLHAQMK
jgi:hypothetical protein